MTATYTPGPWSVELDVVDEGDIGVFATDGHFNGPIPGTPICNVDVRGDPDDKDCVPREVALANAKLIAAAPKMAALLLSGWQHVSHGGPTRGDVEDLLREAGVLPGIQG